MSDLPGAVRFLERAQENRDQTYKYKTPGGDPTGPTSAFSQVLSSRARLMSHLLTLVSVASAAAIQCNSEPVWRTGSACAWPECIRAVSIRAVSIRATKPANNLVDYAVALRGSSAALSTCLRTTGFWADVGTAECVWQTSTTSIRPAGIRPAGVRPDIDASGCVWEASLWTTGIRTVRVCCYPATTASCAATRGLWWC
jgi:hypothetical protein